MTFPRQKHWIACHFLLQGIFPTQGSNLGFPHCRQTLYHLSHQGILQFRNSSEKWSISCHEKVKALVVQSCPTLFDPMDCSPPGSSIRGILHTKILDWVSISFSRGSSWLRDQTQVSHIAGRLFTIWATREFCNSEKWSIYCHISKQRSQLSATAALQTDFWVLRPFRWKEHLRFGSHQPAVSPYGDPQGSSIQLSSVSDSLRPHGLQQGSSGCEKHKIQAPESWDIWREWFK